MMLKREFLENISLFAGFSDELLQTITDSLGKCEFLAGDSIFKKGDEKGVLYLISKGKVRVHNDEYTFIELASGSFFGEYSLIDTKSRSASVTALEDCELWCLSKESFDKVALVFPELQKNVMTALIKRLRKMNELEQNLVQKNQEIAEANDQLTVLNQERSDLIGMMAHDLRNPLASAMSIVSLMLGEKEVLNNEQEELLSITKNALNRMNDMISRTVESQMLDSGLLQLQIEKVEISTILQKVVSNYQNTALEKKITLKYSGLTSSVFLEVDERYLYQSIENLVTNAIKFSPKETTIEVNLAMGEAITISVIDQGLGIRKEEMAMLFKKYQKLSARPTAGEKSTGLGLYIVKKLIEEMGGTIHCESEVDEGSHFIIYFPNN